MAVPPSPIAPATACHLAAWIVAAVACAGAAVVPHRESSGRDAPRPGAAQQAAPRTIEVRARRFAFEPSLVEVTVGEPVRLLVRSDDGVHGFAVERLGINREIPRGGTAVTIDFVATEAGRFPIVCSEYCGSGHEEMTGMLAVRARDAAEPPPGTPPGEPPPQE
jgi:cytochrome c oxidase subunit 2